MASNLLAMASILLALASNLYNRDGLQPTGDGLQPNSKNHQVGGSTRSGMRPEERAQRGRSVSQFNNKRKPNGHCKSSHLLCWSSHTHVQFKTKATRSSSHDNPLLKKQVIALRYFESCKGQFESMFCFPSTSNPIACTKSRF